MADSKYTVVQHSGYGYARKAGFDRGLEPRSVTKAQEKAVVKAGGVVFANYGEASKFVEAEEFPAGYMGMYPQAPGTFATYEVDGLAVYVPKAKTFNVHVGVVELVEATTAQAAVAVLRERLTKAGFEPHDEGADAFESEKVEV